MIMIFLLYSQGVNKKTRNIKIKIEPKDQKIK